MSLAPSGRIKFLVTGARGGSFGDVARGSGGFAATSTDSDAQVLDKFAQFAITQNPGFQSVIPGPAGPTFTTIAAFKAASTSNRKQSLLAIAGRAPGDFYFDSANRSADVTRDTKNAVYIAPSGDTSGASGAWVRARNGTEILASWLAVGDGIADDTAALQALLDLSPDLLSLVRLDSNCKYRITKSLIIRRGRGFVSDGSAEIIADFSTPSTWANDFVAIKYLIDTPVSNAALQGAYGQISGNWRLSGLNAQNVVSTGIRLYTSQTIAVGLAVTYAYLWGTLENVNIKQFDTGMVMNEVWCSVFTNINITYCRRGLLIEGKTVNVVFYGFQAQNPTNDFTSSTAPTCAFQGKSGFQYTGGAEGRPEGVTFIGGLMFGFFNNIILNNFLKIVFDKVIIDGGTDNGVEIIGPDLTTFDGCYFYSGANNKSCINFQPVGTGTNSAIAINNCEFVGAAGTTQNAISFVSGGAFRQGVNITNNHTQGMTRFISGEMTPIHSNITGNFSEAHVGTQMIYVQSGGEGTIIDGNHCGTANVYPVFCQPSTSPRLVIGQNTSPSYQTQYSGQITIPQGATSALMPNKMYSSENYTRAITSATPNGNVGQWYVAPESSGSQAGFILLAPVGAAVSVRYTVTCIPYSATV